jgi:SAM-dependent methyltransferase
VLANPAERFSGRVESYRHYRPGYPEEIVDQLRRECGLKPDAAVADVAAGTGLLAEIFLRAGFLVTAVEPNPEMRAVCSELEQNHPKLRCVAGTAEATGLPDHSADLITVGQAMHWFDLERTRAEFARILRPGGWCAVVYNNRKMSGDAFHEAYERFMLDFGIDYLSVKEQHVGRRRLAQFFAPAEMRCSTFANAQQLTLEALEGRVLSSSYMPQPGHAGYPAMKAALAALFAEHQSGGTVTMMHDCVVCYGQLSTR